MAAPATTSPSTPIRSNVPGTRVLHAINPVVSLILRSPLHRMLSGRVLLLTFTGHETGKTYTIPVGYTPENDALLLFTDHGWWRNFEGGGAPVTVLLQGRERIGHAEANPTPVVVVAAVERLIARYGAKDAGNRVGLALDPKAPPSHADLMVAMTGHIVVSVTFS
jgi:hypothetical protein